MSNNALTFSIDKVELLEKVSNNEIMKVKMLIAKSGLNRHGMIITNEAIRQSAFTFIGKPILAKYNKFRRDAEGHEIDQQPVGVCAFSESDISIVEVDDVTFLYTVGYIWQRYCSNIAELFEEDGSRPISMEILAVEVHEDSDKVKNIDLFVATGCTILGAKRMPAIEGAFAEMMEFEKLVENTANILGFSIPRDEWGNGEKIKIDLSKDSVDFETDSQTIDFATSLNAILKTKNYQSLVNSCYLIKESGWEENPIKHLKCQICEIKDDKLVYVASALENAVSFFEDNQDASYKSSRAKLAKIISKLELPTKNTEMEDKKMFDKKSFLEKFSMTAGEMRDCIYLALSTIKYADGDEMMTKYWMRDYNDEVVFAEDCEEGKIVAIPFTCSDGVCTFNLEAIKSARQTWVVNESVEEEANDDDMYSQFVAKNEAKEKAEVEAKMEALKSEAEKFSAEKEEISQKLSESAVELERLSKFEQTTLENDIKMKFESIINEVSDSLNVGQVDEWRSKVSEFNNLSDFGNAIKAFAFEVNKNKETKQTNRIAIPFEKQEDTNEDSWSKMKRNLKV